MGISFFILVDAFCHPENVLKPCKSPCKKKRYHNYWNIPFVSNPNSEQRTHKYWHQHVQAKLHNHCQCPKYAFILFHLKPLSDADGFTFIISRMSKLSTNFLAVYGKSIIPNCFKSYSVYLKPKGAGSCHVKHYLK